MEELTGKRFSDVPASAIVINSKPITSVQTVKEMASELILNLQALDTSGVSYPGKPIRGRDGWGRRVDSVHQETVSVRHHTNEPQVIGDGKSRRLHGLKVPACLRALPNGLPGTECLLLALVSAGYQG